jgi:hypothetical protein
MRMDTLDPVAAMQRRLIAGPNQRLFTAFGVQWLAAPSWWLGPVWMLAAGVVIAWFAASADGASETLSYGIVYGLGIIATLAVHIFGHLISSNLAGAPFYAQLLTPTFQVNLYDDTPQPRRVHLMRASGGPLANLLVGVLAVLAALATGGNAVLWHVAMLNLLFTLLTLTPVSYLDGGVIWRK